MTRDRQMLLRPSCSVAVETETVEKAAPPERVWHICSGKHPVGDCRPGCVSYCGKVYRPGGGTREPRGSSGVRPIDICVICQGNKAARS